MRIASQGKLQLLGLPSSLPNNDGDRFISRRTPERFKHFESKVISLARFYRANHQDDWASLADIQPGWRKTLFIKATEFRSHREYFDGDVIEILASAMTKNFAQLTGNVG